MRLVCRHGVDNWAIGANMIREKLTHKVSFRLDDETWLRLESAARDSGLRPNDWVRELTIENLVGAVGLRPSQRLFFEQFVRTQYLVANGFQLLAENKLTADEWKKFRAAAKEKIDLITDRAMTDFRSRRKGDAGKANPIFRDEASEF